MALNTGHFEGGVLIHQGESILLHSPSVQISFSGNDELKFGEKTGNAYLTTHRMIFLVGKTSGPASFKSFSFPFVCLSEVDVEQPVFGSNFLKGKVRAQPDGGWRGEAKFKMIFKHGGAIDFAQGMVMAMRIAKQMNSQNPAWSQPPPSYTQATTGGFHQAPPNYYSTPQNCYGWMPPAHNFPAPDAGSIYINDAPPPYPGMTPQGQGQQQQPQGQFQQQPQQQFYPPPQGQFYQQQQTGGYHQPQQNAGYAPQGYAPVPQNAPEYSPQNGFQGYPQQAYGAQQTGGFGYPPAPQNGFAYANGNQAFIPASAPPSYNEASKKSN